MQSASNFGMSQGYTLFYYRGLKEGETGLGWIVKRGNNEREHPRRKKLEECHQSQSRLKERGWERIKTASQNKKMREERLKYHP